MTKRFSCFLIFLFACCAFLSAGDVISEYTRNKVEDFVTYRVTLKSEDHAVAYKKIDALKKEAFAELPSHAKDFEQEKCLLESLYFAEYYEHALNADGNQKELRAEMKRIMKNNFACIDARKKDQVCDWLYLLSGDVTAYYMTRSLAATLLYGMKVKEFYEKASVANPMRASAYVSFGNWCFYAPAIVGGGKAKAQKNFDNAEKCVVIPGEKYLVYIAQSQLNYENDNKAAAQKYLDKAIALDLGRKDLDLIIRCNQKGISYFKYLRNRSGVDEEMPEDEKDEDDK